jgi:hypothetical protein
MSKENNSLSTINVEGFSEIMKTAPGVLERNELAISNANAAGQALLDTVQGNGGIDSDELDAKVAGYIDKIRITLKEMNERRKPLTQLLQTVSKRFTSLEADIDIKVPTTQVHKLQDARNKYATKKLQEQRKREEEQRKEQMTENEKATYRSGLVNLLDNAYNNYIEKQISFLNNLFESITIENYNEKARLLKETSAMLNWNAFVDLNVKDTIQTFYISAETRTSIKNDVATKKREELSGRYKFEVEGLRDDLISRLSSKKTELEQIEDLRKQDAEAAQKAEEEQRTREAAEAQKRAKAREAEEAQRSLEAKATAATQQAASLFDTASSAMPTVPVSAKVTKKIEVLNPQGFLLVYQLWFQKEGFNMTMADLEKVHKKMITFCEKVANKEDEFIKSPFVRYVDDIKAK